MAAQHTLNASPMQACRSSWVSAIAVEHKNGIVNITAIRAGTCFDLADSMGSVSLPEADENARVFGGRRNERLRSLQLYVSLDCRCFRQAPSLLLCPNDTLKRQSPPFLWPV
jgi:hypothetical protein